VSCGGLQVLTYFDSFSAGYSPIEDAADILGMSATVTQSGSDFATGLAAGTDVVVIDVPGNELPTEVLDGVGEVISDGGLLVFSWWDLGGDTALQSTLGISVTTSINSPGQMYPAEGSVLWDAVESVPEPMRGSDNAGINGQINSPLEAKSSELLGLYGDDVKKPAILSVFDRTVIVNGYLPWDFQYADGDKDKVIDATELYVNELAWITNCVP